MEIVSFLWTFKLEDTLHCDLLAETTDPEIFQIGLLITCPSDLAVLQRKLCGCWIPSDSRQSEAGIFLSGKFWVVSRTEELFLDRKVNLGRSMLLARDHRAGSLRGRIIYAPAAPPLGNNSRRPPTPLFAVAVVVAARMSEATSALYLHG